MTAYDTLIQEGRIEGIEEGLEKGVINLYKKQFDIPQISDIMEISVGKVKDILEKYKIIE